MQTFDLDEEVFCRPDLRRGSRERADRVDQVGRTVGRAALVATVAVLVGRMTGRVGACSPDEPVGEKGLGHGIVELGDFLLDDEACLTQRRPDFVADRPVGIAVGAAVIVEGDVEPGEVPQVGCAHIGDHLGLRPAFLPGPDHDRRAVRVVRADVYAGVPPQLLEADPDVGLDVLDQMT